MVEIDGYCKKSFLIFLQKRNLIQKNYVIIVWLEDDIDVYTKIEPLFKQNAIHIVVHPLASGLYQVKLFGPSAVVIVSQKYRDVFNISKGKQAGPVMDNMILRKDNLATLVRYYNESKDIKINIFRF